MLRTLLSPIVLVFLVTMGVGVHLDGNIVLCLIVAIGLSLCASLYIQLKGRSDMLANSRDDYIKRNPSCFISGKITCNHCSSEHISSQTDRKYTDFWAHSCRLCGTTLFHTKK